MPTTNRHPDRVIDRSEIEALVGWSAVPIARGITLRIDSARSPLALTEEQVHTARLVLTNNQALLLARYLLAVTGQTLPAPPSRSWLSSFRAMFGRTERQHG